MATSISTAGARRPVAQISDEEHTPSVTERLTNAVKVASAAVLDRSNPTTAQVQDMVGHGALFATACYLIYKYGHKLAV